MHMWFIDRRMYEQSVSAQSRCILIILEVWIKHVNMFINVVRWILDLSVFLIICFYNI